MEEDFDRELKVLVVGNGGVGKTSMIRRFAKGIYTDEYKKTIGVDFLEKALFVDDLAEEVRFMLWDTAGQEEFDAITRTYYRGAGAAVIAFSTTDRASYEAVEMWKNKVEAECGDIAMALVQNKVDLIDQAVAGPDDVEALARRCGLKLYRTCVKENINVTEVFTYLAELNQRKANAAPPPAETTTGGPAMQPGMDEEPPMEKQKSKKKQQQQQQDEPHFPGRSGESGARTVDLGPSKKRTKGKKKLTDRMTSCSLA